MALTSSWQFDTQPFGQTHYKPVAWTDFTKWSVTSGSYGSLGSADIHVDVHHQPYGDIANQARQAVVTAQLFVTSGNTTDDVFFGGAVDTVEMDFNTDELTIHCRDAGARLMESSIESRVFQNTTVAQCVTELALAVNLQIDQVTGQGTDQTVGYYFNSTGGSAEKRSTAWELIQRLASETGNVAFATPTSLFYFGPRERTSGDIVPVPVLHWNYGAGDSDFIRLSVEAQPYRNGIFFVIVQSHLPHNGGNAVGTALYVNEAIAKAIGSTAGIHTGMTLAQANRIFDPQFNIGGTTPEGLQVYNFNASSLTAQGARQAAIGHALDIQGHEFVVKATVLGTSELAVGMQFTIQGTGQASVDNRTFTVVGHETEFDISGGTDVGGFVTHLTAWASSVPVTGG